MNKPNRKQLSTRILIIYTGGTVGMVIDAGTGALKPIGFKEIRDNIPEIVKLGYEFEVHAFNPPMDSSNMHPKVWVELALIIEKEYDRYDGFVILHGSDTMAFTASALSFLLENLSKPVVLTGETARGGYHLREGPITLQLSYSMISVIRKEAP